MAEGQVGPYRILERLGAGAQGVVFLAEDTRLHRRVALKRVAGTTGSEAVEVRRKLLREARAAARLNHPNIAAVYDVLESDEGVHIVMEYVPGTTLAARVRSGPLPPMQVLDLGLQLSSALAHAHELGVVHRDLKPANVMMAPSGQVKVLDFGLARLHTVDAGSAAFGSSDLSTAVALQIVGTPPYMPPEVLRGEGYDARSDIYSLGVSLFELLTGRRPFEPRDRTALMAAILNAPTPRPRSVSPDVPAGLDNVIYRTMARHPNDRYQSVADLQADLARLSAAIGDPPTVGRRTSLLWTHGQRRLGSALLAIVAVGLALFMAAGPIQRAPRQPVTERAPHAARAVVAVLPFSGVAGDAQAETFASGAADALISAVSRLPDVSVVSRAATLKHAGRTQGPAVISRELGATLLIDGAFRRTGDQMQVTLSIFEPGSNVVTWRQTYERAYADMPNLQRDVASAVAAALRLQPGATGKAYQAAHVADVVALKNYAEARLLLERPDVPGQLDRSIRLFESVIARDRGFARAHAGLGEACWRKYQATREEQWSIRALDSMTEALRLDPDEPTVRLSLAAVYRNRGRVQEAIDELRRVVAEQPTFDEAHRHLGQALFDTGAREAGLASLNEAIRLRPSYWAHHYSLGVAYYSAGRYGEAVSCFEKVVDLQPDHAWGYNMLGTVHYATDDTARAIAAYEQAIKLGHAKAYANLGALYLTDNRVAEAVRSYSEAMKREPGSPVTHHNLADAYWIAGDKARARQHYHAAVKLSSAQVRVNPRDAATLVTLAVVQAKLGRHEVARADIDRALQLAPESADVWHGQATIYALTGRVNEARAAVKRAVSYGYSRKRIAADAWLQSVLGSSRMADGAS